MQQKLGNQLKLYQARELAKFTQTRMTHILVELDHIKQAGS